MATFANPQVSFWPDSEACCTAAIRAAIGGHADIGSGFGPTAMGIRKGIRLAILYPHAESPSAKRISVVQPMACGYTKRALSTPTSCGPQGPLTAHLSSMWPLVKSMSNSRRPGWSRSNRLPALHNLQVQDHRLVCRTDFVRLCVPTSCLGAWVWAHPFPRDANRRRDRRGRSAHLHRR